MEEVDPNEYNRLVSEVRQHEVMKKENDHESNFLRVENQEIKKKYQNLSKRIFSVKFFG